MKVRIYDEHGEPQDSGILHWDFGGYYMHPRNLKLVNRCRICAAERAHLRDEDFSKWTSEGQEPDTE